MPEGTLINLEWISKIGRLRVIKSDQELIKVENLKANI